MTTGTDPDTSKPTLTWQRDHAAITAASRLDGLYALATNLPDPKRGKPVVAMDILKIYKDQWVVEQRHRDLKQTLRVRPVFLHNDDRITALVAVVGIALLIFGLIEADLRRALGPNTHYPDYSAKAMPPNPPAAASSPPSPTYTSPTPPPAPSSTGSPTPNALSSPTSISPCPGPR